jgi:hypothetical protein
MDNSILNDMEMNNANRIEKFTVRRICPSTGKLHEMSVLMTKRHFLLAHKAFKNHTGDRTLIPYLTEPEYRFLFEGISPGGVPQAQVSHCQSGSE